MSLLEIVKPAAQRRIQFDDNFRQTIPARALGPHPDAIVHGLKTLAPHPASPHFEVIAQKVKALPPLPTVSHVGLLGASPSFSTQIDRGFFCGAGVRKGK